MRNVPLSIRTGPVLRMQQASASGSQTTAVPLPPHLRAQRRELGGEGAEGVDRPERQAGDVQGNRLQPVDAWQPEGVIEADVGAARVPVSQNGKIQTHDLEARDGSSTAAAAVDAAVEERESIEQSRATGGPHWSSSRQLTYKGIVFDLETTGTVHLSSYLHAVGLCWAGGRLAEVSMYM